jgi:bifunctional damage-control phosphatase, subfamily II, fusion protein
MSYGYLRSASNYRRVMMFVDNAGADVVLGQLPIAREFLLLGCEVVMVANQLPAINDITGAELAGVLKTAAQHCPTIRAARDKASSILRATSGRVPKAQLSGGVPALFIVDNGQGSPCLSLRRVPAPLAEAAVNTDLIIIEGMGR